ncbi:hypothetical protein GCM10007063_25630 [Lentibacillus kapialis]|uniref:Uncharacterized protein n=1 Tax=Lentibacillus kapialis TaxID=340214 RepID=A0A917PZT9_9BACI|nr:hypothetical protein [Lentibacillus kapialis]GGK02204.1 hypothetical protein GCM10007063_25630 [Lentibacillus kapialis]
MNRYQKYYLIGIGLLMAGGLILALLVYNSSNGNENSNNCQEFYRSVNSPIYPSDNAYQNVNENFSKAGVWRSYPGDKEDISVGLDADKANRLYEIRT